MTFLNNLFFNPTTAQAIIVLAISIFAGLAIGRVKIAGVRLGVGGVLFSGIALGHFGMSIEPHVLHYAQEFGLILFVYCVGMGVGPTFMESFRDMGLKLNGLAVLIAILGAATVVFCFRMFGLDADVAVGLYCGAVTNTPALSAASQMFGELPDVFNAAESVRNAGMAYAVAYPFGIFGIIITMLLVKAVFRVDVKSESSAAPAGSKTTASAQQDDHPHVMSLFFGIFAGVLLGSIPIYVPGLPAPLKFGLAGGPLIMSIFLARKRNLLGMTFSMTPSANSMVREIGIALFLACVGVNAGGRFVDTLVHGQGLYWMAIATLITAIPILIAGFVGYAVLKVPYGTLCGVLSGGMTDPPALAFANQMLGTDAPSTGYATVYPLTMFLRIFAGQALVVAFAAML